jgi:hypothetical protein
MTKHAPLPSKQQYSTDPFSCHISRSMRPADRSLRTPCLAVSNTTSKTGSVAVKLQDLIHSTKLFSLRISPLMPPADSSHCAPCLPVFPVFLHLHIRRVKRTRITWIALKLSTSNVGFIRLGFFWAFSWKWTALYRPTASTKW